MKKSVSIIVAAYNEEKNLDCAIEAIHCSIAPFEDIDFEIIIVNDGSIDQTENISNKIIKKYTQIKLINHEKNLGLGQVFKTGVLASTKEYLIMLPGDTEAKSSRVEILLKYIGCADLLIPYPDSKKSRGIFRAILSDSFAKITRLLSGLDINYFNGSVLYKRSLLLNSSLNTSNYAYQAKLLTEICNESVTYIQIPIITNDNRKIKSANTSAFRLKNIIGVISTLFLISIIRIKTYLKS
jgi:glycosyltransferase involved in cell wall biosynthesis